MRDVVTAIALAGQLLFVSQGIARASSGTDSDYNAFLNEPAKNVLDAAPAQTDAIRQL